MIAQLLLNDDTGRIEHNGTGLHAGDPLTVMIVDDDGNSKWIDTRIEYDDYQKWYLVGLVEYQVEGLFAKY